MTLNTKGQAPDIHVTTSPESQISLLRSSTHTTYMPFWDKCIEWPQKDNEHYQIKGTPYTYDKYPEFHIWVRCSMASCFRVLGHYETSVSNDPPNNFEH